MVLGLRNVVGTSALAKEEANEAQTDGKKNWVQYTSLKHLQKFQFQKHVFQNVCAFYVQGNNILNNCLLKILLIP